MLYVVPITETLQRNVYVEAPDGESAYKEAYRLYEHGEIILDANDFYDSEVCCEWEASDQTINPDYIVTPKGE